MDKNQYAYDASVIKPVTEIQFDILGNDEIRAMSALAGTHGIEIPDLYDKQEPKRGGLIDPRMGGSGNTLCATCQLDGKHCDGHPAHIDLAEAVFHPLYLQYVKNILDCICIGCSNLLISKEDSRFKHVLQIKSKKNRLVKIHELASKAKFCSRPQQNCGIRVSKIKVEIKKSTSAINIFSETEAIEGDEKDKKKHRLNLTPDMIAEILDNISDEDCRILGIDPDRSRPSDMIHKVFLVPPVHVRPSLRGFFSGGSTMEDGLTHKLADIIKANTRINKQKENNNENSSKYSKDHAHLLQYHVATYFDPDMITVPKMDSKGANFKPLVARFKGKTGRIRGNIMGKRGDFNARTVITSDPTISVNYLGVPVKIAMNLTFPEIVTEYNIKELTKLVRNGPDVYPGANYVFRGNVNIAGGNIRPIYLKFNKEEINLQYGDVVERHLRDGDIVLLNRQPTLHKQSMMGHRIKVINDDTLLTYRLSVAATPPYNADFDGDEMNIFVPQSIQTRLELEEIADVKKQLITPSRSTTCMGIVQDGLLGAYNLTDERMKVDWRTAMNIISYTSFDDFSVFKKKKDFTGAEIFSMIIPPNISLKRDSVEIKNGDIMRGFINKDLLGAGKKNNLIQYIWDEYGQDAARNFIDNTQRLVNNFNLWNGFTVGVSDAAVYPEAKKEIITYLENVMNKVDVDITNLENNPSYMTNEIFERKLFNDMNVVRDDVSKMAMGSIPDTNKFGIMINSGSKGGPTNLGQMAGCVGLQVFEGSLMPKMYYDRTLCYFHENDDRAKSRGLCYHSYMDGLDYPEFVYHTKTSRAGLIEQVVKTSETGYAQRKLIKTMEDVMVKYDGTVRIANNQIVQQTYGGNGADTTKQYEYRIGMIKMNNEQLAKKYTFTKEELKDYSDFSESDNKELYDQLKTMRDSVRRNIIKAKVNYITLNDAFMIPINLARIMSIVSKDATKNKKISPKYIINSIDDLLSLSRASLIRVPVSEEENPAYYTVEDDKLAKTIMRFSLYDALNPKIINEIYNISKDTFDALIGEIERSFNDNIVEPGEMVGIIAAQSLGEAVTQMTLNAFHHSGIATLTHSTGGVPRINELISATKNPKTPQMFIYLDKENKNSREMAHKIGSYLEKTTVGGIRNNLDVYYDPNPSAKGGIMEKDGITEPFYSKKLTRNSCQASVENLPWLIRIEVDKEKMLEKEVTLLDIKSKFCMWWDRRHVNTKKKKDKITTLKKITSFAMLSNNDNDPKPVIHIRFNVKDLDKSEIKKGKGSIKFDRKTIIDFVDMIDKFKLKGVDGIETMNAIVKERYIDVDDGDGMEMGDEQVIYTSGVNLKDTRYITGIDMYRTFSDDIQEMFNTFGIEVARNRLIGEYSKAYENAGNNVNPQHISILVDIMCYGGSVISADRHGMKKANIDPLSKASFEKSVDILVGSAVFGDNDKMQGISSRMYVGQVIKGGTGYCELILDTGMIQNSEYIERDDLDHKSNLATNTIANAIMEDTEGEEIFIPE